MSRVVAEEYGDKANFVLTHSAGKAANEHWQLTHWQPETAVGQQARGRVFAPTPLHVRGFRVLPNPYGDQLRHDDDVEVLFSKIATAGGRLLVEFGDPYMRQITEGAGPVWLKAHQRLLELPVPDSDSGFYYDERVAALRVLRTAPDAPPDFVRPIDAAFEAEESGNADQAEQIMRDAAMANVLDVRSWSWLASSALDDGRLEEALGFAEAAVAVAERSIPDRFSGMIVGSEDENMGYLGGRETLTNVLWSLGRFDDAYKVAVDTIWLDPTAWLGVKEHLEDIKSHTPRAEALLNYWERPRRVSGLSMMEFAGRFMPLPHLSH
jgi:tetratricopeptide (TPR) repeat protein